MKRGVIKRTATPEQLPIWPEPVRGCANVLLRSAFFAAQLSKDRIRLGIYAGHGNEDEGVTIAAQDGIAFKYTGWQLNQYDADVFFEALHLARRHPLETECTFKGNAFLQAIGRRNSSREYEDLDQSLRRLQRGTVDVEWTAYGRDLAFTGSLISNYVRDKETKLYKITFAKEIMTLFCPASWTQLEWDERMSLKSKPIAQWLHSYYSTHAAPFPVSVAYLLEKSGSRATLKHFRESLKAAFKLLEERLGWTVEWDGDVVTVHRKPSGSQARLIEYQAQQSHRRKKAKTEGIQRAGDLLPGIVKTRI